MSAFLITDPLDAVVTRIDGNSYLGNSYSFTGTNSVYSIPKYIKMIGPTSTTLRNLDITFPSTVPVAGQLLAISTSTYNSDGDTQSIALTWVSDSSGPFAQDATNIYNVSSGAPTGIDNVIAGVNAALTLKGNRNVAIGYQSGSTNMENDNITIGYQALSNVAAFVAGANTGNIAIGSSALVNGNGGSAGQNINNICIGEDSGDTITSGYNNICIGEGSDVSTATAVNQIVIGQNAVGKGNNTALIGNDSTTDVFITSNSAGSPSNLVFIGDNAGGSDFLYKIRAPSNASLNSQREWILPSNTPTVGDVLQVSGVAAGPPNVATLSWVTPAAGGVTSITGTASQVLANGTTGSAQTGAITLTLPQNIAFTSSPQFANLYLNNSTLAQNTLLQLYNDSNGNINTMFYIKYRAGGLSVSEVMGQETKYGYNSTNTIWTGMTTYTLSNNSTAGAENATTLWESMSGGTLAPTFGFIGYEIYYPKLSTNTLAYFDTSRYMKSTTLTGTSNQITVTGLGTSTITLSTPQNIATTSSPQFSSLGLGIAASTSGTLNLAGSTSGNIIVSPGATPTTYTLTLPSSGGTSGQVLSTNGSGTTSWITPGFQIYADTKPAGTAGGASAGIAWQTRTLNTAVAGNLDGTVTSLAANVITFNTAGTYIIQGSAPGFAVQNTQVRLWNVTSGAQLQAGTSLYSLNAAPSTTVVSSVYYYGAIAAATQIRLEQFTQRVDANGLGVAVNATTEVYAVLQITRVL